MKSYDLVIIGSGPAGTSAATSYVESGGTGRVLLVSADRLPPYQRPPLTKDVLAGRSDVEATPIEGSELPDQVEIKLGTTVSSIDLTAHSIRAGDEAIAFERLIVAVGAQPIPFPYTDADAEVLLLRSFDDAERLVASAQRARSAVVIGSGFIGCEAAASLAIRGVDTTLVTPEQAPQIDRLGEFAASRIQEWLTGLGVELRTGVQVAKVAAPSTVHLDDGHSLSPDLVLAAVGVTPGGEQFADSGLQLHEGRIVADDHLQVAPDVWAAGDVARAHHAIAARPVQVEHWGDALAMGELAGRNAASDDDDQQQWRDVPGFWSTIGEHTLKYAAWGDGHECVEVVESAGAYTVWYADAEGTVVGVLTYNNDHDYERGQIAIEAAESLDQVLAGAVPATDDEQESPNDADG